MTSANVGAGLGICLALLFGPALVPAETRATRPAGVVAAGRPSDEKRVSSGRAIAAPPGASAPIGSMPLNAVVSPDGEYVITTGAGYREEVCCVRVSDATETGRVEFKKNAKHPNNGLYYGLAFGPSGLLYAAGGGDGEVAVLTLSKKGELKLQSSFQTGATDFPAGIAIDHAGRLFVTQNDPLRKTEKSPAFGVPASVSVHDARGQELGRYTFASDYGTSNFPLAVAVNDAGTRCYVASERDNVVYVLNTSDPKHITQAAALPTGAHPIALLLNKSRSTLYVANAHSDTVSIVDTASDKITGTIRLRPQVAQDLAGATPTGMALSASEKLLYVTLGDMNALAVVDLAEEDGPEVEGYVPTGWYPTAVAVTPGRLWVTNAKGDKSRTPHDFVAGKRTVASPLTLFEGTLWGMPVPHKAELEQMTKTTLENARLTPAFLGARNPLQDISRTAGGIKHVIYVVKENRTYDQILGDLPQGNGDPDRCIFGRDITPNLHAIAERFVLLDNFYDSGDVSGDGWTWSTQAHANEYTVRNVPYQYSSRGRAFDYEGTNNEYPTGGFPATGPDGKPLSQDPRFAGGGKPVPDVAEAPGGHLWDMVQKHGLSYRNYGFFVQGGIKQDGKQIIPDNYPSVAALQPGGRDLAGVTDVDYRCFHLDFPDSDAPSDYAAKTGDPSYFWTDRAFGAHALPSRISEWKREFAMMLAKDPTGNAVPAFMTVRLGTDHTKGANPLNPTPQCMVADNDYACGQLVEAVSHSPIWPSTAILIIEDDAQNGPDHVDAHRSVCYVASPWIKRGSIDHSFQNTVSTIRTIESLLDLPPMCQYDAASDVIHGWDRTPSNLEPYTPIYPAATVMKQRNPVSNKSAPVSPEDKDAPPTTRLNTTDGLAAVSAALDFSRADQAPADLLNAIIWKTVKGPAAQMPPTPHAPSAGEPKKDDDD